MRNKYLDILSKPSKSKTPNGFLATFFRLILDEEGKVDRIPSLISRYHSLSRSTVTQLRNTDSILKELTSENITFSVFIKLLSGLLMVRKIRFTVTLTYQDNTTSHHSKYLYLQDEETPNDTLPFYSKHTPDDGNKNTTSKTTKKKKSS